MPCSHNPPCCPWLHRMMLVGLILALGTGCLPSPAEPEAKPAANESISVTLRIDFPGDDDLETEIEASAPATVSSVLERAAEQQLLTFTARGQGEFWFLESINDVTNRGADGDNWIFLVNEQTGRASAGASSVSDGDTITWRFGAEPSWQ